jgi:hypothetical protein
MDDKQSQDDFATQVIESTVAHGRKMLVTQMQTVRAGEFDLMPAAVDTTTDLYLAGVMWRFGEQFDLPTTARDRGFICLMCKLVEDGMNKSKAQERIAYLNQISRTTDGQDNRVIATGYHAQEFDGSLSTIFEAFRDAPEMSGAPYRMLDRAKAIAAILAVSGALLALLVGKSWGVALGVSAVLGGAVLAIALAMYRQAVKQKSM